MNRSLTADQPDAERRWGSVWVTKVKKYIRRRPMIKYTLFGLGFVFCLFMMLLLYLGLAGDSGDDDAGSETLLVPVGRYRVKRLQSVLLAQDTPPVGSEPPTGVSVSIDEEPNPVAEPVINWEPVATDETLVLDELADC